MTDQRRPTDGECVQAIDLVADGKSLSEACRDLGLHIPSTNTMIRKAREEGGLNDQYEAAVKWRATLFGDRVVDLGMAMLTGKYTMPDGTIVDMTYEKGRLAIDALKWHAGRMHAKLWGDKQQTELTGTDGGPVVIRVNTGVPRAGDADADD